MLSDIKYALRGIRKNVKFSLLAIFVMTTGLSLSIYMFSFLGNTIHAPLPFAGGDRIKVLMPITDREPWMSFRLSDYEDLLEAQNSFEILDTYYNGRRNILTSDRSFREQVFFVNPPFFQISEAKPMLGRLLIEDDLKPGAEPVVLIGEEIWKTLFASDINVLGRVMRIENVPHKIVGVMPGSYRFPDYAKIWAPFDLTTQGLERRDSPYAPIYGRLKSGVTVRQAEADIQRIMKQLENQYPDLNKGLSAYITTFQERASMTNSRLILAMALCVILVLLLACINTGNLLLSRAFERSKETAICLALGAPKRRVIFQVMFESLFICFVSGILALCIVSLCLNWSLTALSAMFRASEAPYWWKFDITAESVLVGMLLIAFTSLVTGILPAWRAVSGNINEVLRDGTRGAQGLASGKLSRAVVIVEVAMSASLLLVASSVALSVYGKNNTDYGIRLDGYLTAEVELDRSEYDTDEKIINYFAQLEERLEQDPRVLEVAYTRMVPITWAITREFIVEGVNYGSDPHYPNPEYMTVSPDYFETMEVRLYEGRALSERDTRNTPLVAVVTEQFVDKHLPGQEVIGKRIRLVDTENEWYTIVGVVNDVVHGWPYWYNLTKPTVFVSMNQIPSRSMSIVVKAMGDPDQLQSTLRDAAYDVEPNAPLFNVFTIERNHERAVADINFISRLFSAFAIASLVLAFSGIYGVMAYITTQKTQEIGVRRALGATNTNIYKHFLKKGSVQLILGLLVGLPLGLALQNMLAESELVTNSIVLFLCVPLAIAVTIFIAVVNPVRRILDNEPCQALRYE